MLLTEESFVVWQLNKKKRELAMLNGFVSAVEEMRHLQREYFRTRQSSVLQETKQAERKVDQMIADFRKGKTQEQGRLC